MKNIFPQMTADLTVHLASEIAHAGLKVVPNDGPVPTFEETKAAHARGYAYVFNGGECERTIFGGDRLTQYLYRAWHDMMHIKHDLDFSIESEYKLAEVLRSELSHTDHWQAGVLFRDDLMLHIKHYEKFGEHPIDQTAMLKEHYAKGVDAEYDPSYFGEKGE